MKLTLRIPTEMYAFAEVQIESKNQLTPDQVKEVYDTYNESFKQKPINSLPTKEWNKLLDNYLLGEHNHLEDLLKCSPEQRKIINEIKKSIERMKAKEPKEYRNRFNEEN